MHSRRIACFIVGMWLAGGLLLFWIGKDAASSAARTLDEPNPYVALRIKTLGREDTRLLLHHAAAEQVRRQTEFWETVQLFGGAFFFSFLLFGTREGKVALGIALLLLIIVISQRFVISPEVMGLGRITDFTPSGTHTGNQVRLLVLRGAYDGFEFAKWGLQVLLCTVLIAHRHRNSEYSGQKFNLVDKADYGHIDR